MASQQNWRASCGYTLKGLVDAAHLEQGQQELGEEADPRPVPGQMFGKDGFEFVNGVFREVGHRARKSG